MKSLIFLIAFLLPALLLGQVKLINKDLHNSDTSLLYGGLENHLVITGQTDFRGFKLVSTSNSEVRMEPQSLTVVPSTREHLETLKLFKAGKLLLTKQFMVVRLNDPIAQLAFTSDTIISVNRILANPFVTSTFPNSLYRLDIVTKSFECLIIKKNGERQLFVTAGNRLSEEMIAAIKSLATNDELIFENIKVGIAPVYCPRQLPDFKVRIQ